MAEKVAKVGVKKEKGHLYFVDKNGDISTATMARGGGRAKKGSKKVAKVGVSHCTGLASAATLAAALGPDVFFHNNAGNVITF